MPPFLPVRATNRSQAVRIGNQLLSRDTTTYVDLGQLSVPLGLRAAATATTGGTLAKSQKYFYFITAIDAYGGETTVSAEIEKETGAGTATNTITLSWLPQINVSGGFTAPAPAYNVYRGTTSGTEVLVASGVTGTTYVDTGANSLGNTNYTLGASAPTTNNTFYPGESNQSVKKDLQAHSAIGAYLVVGGLSAWGTESVIMTGATTTVTNLEVTVAAGELRNRNTGLIAAIAGGVVTFAAASGTEDRTELVWVNATTGAVGFTKGTPAPVTTSVPPALPAGAIPVAAYLVAKSATVAVKVADLRPR